MEGGRRCSSASPRHRRRQTQTLGPSNTEGARSCRGQQRPPGNGTLARLRVVLATPPRPTLALPPAALSGYIHGAMCLLLAMCIECVVLGTRTYTSAYPPGHGDKHHTCVYTSIQILLTSTHTPSPLGTRNLRCLCVHTYIHTSTVHRPEPACQAIPCVPIEGVTRRLGLSPHIITMTNSTRPCLSGRFPVPVVHYMLSTHATCRYRGCMYYPTHALVIVEPGRRTPRQRGGGGGLERGRMETCT